MDANEVAELLGCTPAFVRSLANKGEIPHFRPGVKYIRFRRASIEQWIADSERGS